MYSIHTIRVSADGKTVSSEKRLHSHDRAILSGLIRAGFWLLGLCAVGLFFTVVLGGLPLGVNIALIVGAIGHGLMAHCLRQVKVRQEPTGPAATSALQQVEQATSASLTQPQCVSAQNGGRGQPRP